MIVIGCCHRYGHPNSLYRSSTGRVVDSDSDASTRRKWFGKGVRFVPHETAGEAPVIPEGRGEIHYGEPRFIQSECRRSIITLCRGIVEGNGVGLLVTTDGNAV